MGTKISKEDRLKFQMAFNLFDEDGDGAITVTELAAVLNASGMNPTEGEIDFDEFCEMMANREPTDPEEELRAAFQLFDEDGDGALSSAELRNILLKMGTPVDEATADKVLQEMDADGNGVVDIDEFVTFVLNQQE